jgi:hypothetical protein
MVGIGYAVGFHVHAGFARLPAALLLVLAFSYALSWVFAAIGLLVRDPESAQAASFLVLAALVFASSAFVPRRLDAGLVAAVRRASARLRHGLRRTRARPRDSRGVRRAAGARLGSGAPARLRADRGLALPPSYLSMAGAGGLARPSEGGAGTAQRRRRGREARARGCGL